jgi:hypothetical protein
MDVHRDELAGLAVRFECKRRFTGGFWKIDLAQDVPGLSGITGAALGDPFFKIGHLILRKTVPLSAKASTEGAAGDLR